MCDSERRVSPGREASNDHKARRRADSASSVEEGETEVMNSVTLHYVCVYNGCVMLV